MVMVMGLLLSGANRLGVKAAAPGGGALFAQRRNALGAFAAHAGGKQAGRVVEQRALVFLAAATQQGLEHAVGAPCAGAQAPDPPRHQHIQPTPTRPRRCTVRRPSRATTKGAICAGMRPSEVSLSANFASAVASTRSHAQASPMLPPIAAPSTAAITGTGSALSRCMKWPN